MLLLAFLVVLGATICAGAFLYPIISIAAANKRKNSFTREQVIRAYRQGLQDADKVRLFTEDIVVDLFRSGMDALLEE